MKSDNYCIPFTDQINLQKASIKVWSTLNKYGSNFYEQRK